MQILQRGYFRSLLEKRANSASGSMRRCKGSDTRNVIADRRAPDRFFVIEGFAAQGRVDYQIDLARFHQVHNVGPAFVHFEYRLGLDAGGFQRGSGSTRSQQAKTQRRQLFPKGSEMLFVTVVNTKENR